MVKKLHYSRASKLQWEMEILEQANYFISHKSTVRATARAFMVSKSTIHHNLTQQLPKISPTLYTQVKIILDKNASERHIRGGIATQKKYLALKS